MGDVTKLMEKHNVTIQRSLKLETIELKHLLKEQIEHYQKNYLVINTHKK